MLPRPAPLLHRFGGPGIKKKACLSRICLRVRQQHADDLSDRESPPAQRPPESHAAVGSNWRQPFAPREMQPPIQPTQATATTCHALNLLAMQVM